MANKGTHIATGNIADLSLTTSKGAVLNFPVSFPVAEYDLTGKKARITIINTSGTKFEADSDGPDITINTIDNRIEFLGHVLSAVCSNKVRQIWHKVGVANKPPRLPFLSPALGNYRSISPITISNDPI